MTPPRNAFTWTELLVLLTVLGFLVAVLIPFKDRGHRSGRRTMDASNLRQIGQASLIYANDNHEQLPGLHLDRVGEIDPYSTTKSIHIIAAALARGGGLNDANIWISQEDRHPDVDRKNLTVVLDRGPPKIPSPTFNGSALSFQYIAGLNTSLPSSTPIAFTRGLRPDGTWDSDRKTSVHGDQGGHIVFMGGNVSYYQNLHAGGGTLQSRKGTPTVNVLETTDSTARIFSKPATTTGALDGMPGSAP